MLWRRGSQPRAWRQYRGEVTLNRGRRDPRIHPDAGGSAAPRTGPPRAQCAGDGRQRRADDALRLGRDRPYHERDRRVRNGRRDRAQFMIGFLIWCAAILLPVLIWFLFRTGGYKRKPLDAPPGPD